MSLEILNKIKKSQKIQSVKELILNVKKYINKEEKKIFSKNVPTKYSVFNFLTILSFSAMSIFFAKQNSGFAYGTLAEESLYFTEETSNNIFGDGSVPVSTTFAEIIIPKRDREKPIIYKVQAGDTVSKIASDFELKTSSIIYSNRLSSSNPILKVGQDLIIPQVDGITHMIQKGDTYSSLAKKYRGDLQKTKDVNFEIPFTPGQTITIPNGRPPEVAKTITPTYQPTQVNISNDANLSSENWYWPMSGKITQYFGKTSFNPNHTGIDIATKSGTPIRASKSGTIITATYQRWYGNLVVIDHGGDYKTYYGHMSAFKVSKGDKVEKGQIIGLEGTTGWSTGPHLHFEIRYKNKPTNPLNYTFDNK